MGKYSSKMAVRQRSMTKSCSLKLSLAPIAPGIIGQRVTGTAEAWSRSIHPRFQGEGIEDRKFLSQFSTQLTPLEFSCYQTANLVSPRKSFCIRKVMNALRVRHRSEPVHRLSRLHGGLQGRTQYCARRESHLGKVR